MPRTKSEYGFLIMQLVFGLFLFASKLSFKFVLISFFKNLHFCFLAVLGHVANIVTNVSAARKEFQGTKNKKCFFVNYYKCFNC